VIAVFRPFVQVIAVFRPFVQVIAVFRPFVQFSGHDLSVPSVCGGFLGVSSEQIDLRADDHDVPPVRAVAALVITTFRRFVQSPLGQSCAVPVRAGDQR
jgi:hypothetical protein